MPCEGCNVQFTVFRRKRICKDCRRYYCSHCMITQNSVVLCERCAIFAKRPLLKIDLLKLKPKDLIFYLQSKHISTTGCVEKEELVGLVLSHVNQNDTPNIGSPNGNKFSDFSDSDKPFENIKQTCQNFFNNITDKIATDFSFDTKTTAASNSAGMAGAGGSSPHISEQPRISTREIPSYSSFQNQPLISEQSPPPLQQQQQQQGNSNMSTPTSPISSPVVSMSSISSQSTVSRSPQPVSAGCGTANGQSSSEQTQDKPTPAAFSGVRNRLLENVLQDEGIVSECDCSDDELITTFKDRSNREVGATSTSPTTSSPIDNLAAGTSASGSSNGLAQKSSPSLQVGTFEDSSESSFEELGAIGGISDDNKTESVAQNESWQFVNKSENDAITVEDKKAHTVHREEEPSAGTSTDIALVSSESSSGPSRAARIFASRPKRVVRRRSDGYLNRMRHGDDHSFAWNSKELSVEEEEGDDDDDNDDDDDDDEQENAAMSIRRRRSKCCGKCGKNKTNIKNHVMKLRQHLENAHMSEAEIKQELEEFLVYLENRTRGELVDVGSATSPFFDGNDGIHVYGHVGADGGYDPRIAASRFPNLNDFDSLEELENLTVKQLKQILTLNRVDYKGCCEKQELFERVSRLWKNLKSCPAIEKLPTDELCKICMDAPIECVILECGHMATCTNCGKVLSECPICRQYIVRVVRFFRA